MNFQYKYPFSLIGADKNIEKWSVVSNPDKSIPLVAMHFRVQIKIEERLNNGALVADTYPEKITNHKFSPQMPPTLPPVLRSQILTMRIGDVAWTRSKGHQAGTDVKPNEVRYFGVTQVQAVKDTPHSTLLLKSAGLQANFREKIQNFVSFLKFLSKSKF